MEEKLLREALELQHSNLFAKHNHIEGVSVERDCAVFELTIQPESRNPYGLIHGGALYGMADNAAGFAAHTDGRFYVTQTGTMHFLRGKYEGTVTATAKVRHRGKSTCLVNVDLTDEQGVLIASGEYTFFCVNQTIVEQELKK